MSQTAGDFRSNVTGVFGDWGTLSTWQMYNGVSWAAAPHIPTSADGVISILSGDSVELTSPVTIDQVQVLAGGSLAITGNISVPLNDNPSGDDIIVDGSLYVGAGLTQLTGAGTIRINSSGLFVVRNSGSIEVSSTNNLGRTYFSGNAFIRTGTFVNNNTFVWLDGDIALQNGASFINNDSISVEIPADANFNGTPGTSFTNSVGGVIFKQSATGVAHMFQNVTFSNSGGISGIGEYDFLSTSITNTGSFGPGKPTGILTVDPSVVTGKTPTFNIQINSPGGVAGVNYDQMDFSGAGNVDVTGAILNVYNIGGDPVGTIYTILLSPSGTITGPFATVNLNPTLGNLTYNPNSITVEKTSSALPVVWGAFTTLAVGNTVHLDWSTEEEVNSSHFVVQHSLDGANFTAIGSVDAKGFSGVVANYSFIDKSPSLDGINYYRLLEVDLDGKSQFSVVRTVRFYNGKAVNVQITPNPVYALMLMNIQADDITIVLHDLNGRVLRNWRLARGQHQADVGDLPAGNYQLSIYQKGKRIDVQQMIKL
ncbi:MAG TPA: T9SS type A sorting domain-containing protein [Puia sp.]|nr:T9SS type A sorting domain-containing protein [Puia sp.]